jgi:alkylation response protein AidB-like acyl-CoA dehydrogenase
VIRELARLGAFGIKISPEYGGLGLSQTNYCRAAMLLGGVCGNLTALLSAHQSIGEPQPLILFGTDEQKARCTCPASPAAKFRFCPDRIGGRLGSGDDADLCGADRGWQEFILNGEKLWCTNGTRAGVIVVMAKTPAKQVGGKSKEQVTAFIVGTNWPGVTRDAPLPVHGV